MKQPTPLLTVSSPPHVHCGRTISGHMLETLLALAPAMVLATITFGMPAVRVMALSMGTAVAAEALCFKLMNRTPEVDDLHGLLTGLLLAFLLPASTPWWLVIVGAFITIAMGKAIFGGLGGNPLCAPAVGWAVLVLSWPDLMDVELAMLGSEFAAPLAQLKHFGLSVTQPETMDLLLGRQLGGLGSVQVLALAAGGLYLVIRDRIQWQIPVGFLLGLLGTAAIYHLLYPGEYPAPLFHLLSGGAVFGACFLATDPGSSPVGRTAMLLFGVMAGALVIIIRVYGIYPDGVPFAILLANLASPLLDRIRPKPFGYRPERRGA